VKLNPTSKRDRYILTVTLPTGEQTIAHQLCQTPQRGNEIMVMDLTRRDPFQRAKERCP
jgi:hypothetical protein